MRKRALVAFLLAFVLLFTACKKEVKEPGNVKPTAGKAKTPLRSE